MKKILSKLEALSVAMIITLVLVVSIVLSQHLPDNKPTEGDFITNSNLPTIIIDPGHGGIDGGCVSENGAPEKNINLTIALELRDILTSLGYDVVLTRDTDVSIHDKGITGIANQKKSDMENRLEIINSYENAVAISIHQNQFTDSAYSGAQMFYSDSNDMSGELAACVQNSFVRNLQPDNNREIKEIGNDLYLLYYSECPMIMAECGFLSNPDESAKLQSEDYQKQVAFTIATGLIDFISANY